MITLKEIYNERGSEFIEKLFKHYVIITEMIDGTRFRVKRHGDRMLFFKGNDNTPLNRVDRTLMVYYERPISFFELLKDDIKNLMPEDWQFCFEYVANAKSVKLTYDNVPKNNLIITDILIKNDDDTTIKVISDPVILKKWSDTFGVQEPAIIFQGKLDQLQREKIRDFLNTSQSDLERIFKTQSFTRYIISVLNPQLKKTALNNSLDKMVDSIVFKFINGKKVYNASIIDPMFDHILKQNPETTERKPNDTYQIIMLDIIEFLSTFDIDSITPEGDSVDQRYINLVCEIFNKYVLANSYKYVGMDFQTPKFAKQDVFQLNMDFITNEKTKKILENEKMHDLFKIMLSSFKKIRKSSTDLLSAESIKTINDIITKIENKTKAMPSENEVLDFHAFLKYNNIKEEDIDVFESQVNEGLNLTHKDQGKKKVNMFVGRFQPFTLGHAKVFETIHKQNGLPVVVLIVRGGKPDPERRPFGEELQLKMFKGMQKNYNFLEDAFIVKNASPDTIFNEVRPKYEPVLWGCGSDRVDSYQSMIDKYRKELNALDEFNTFEIHRTGENISATKVREAVKNDDEKSFREMTPKGVWPFFEDMQKILGTVGESSAFRVLSFSDFINESTELEAIFEDLNSKTRNSFVQQFISNYANKYSTASSPDRVNNITKVSLDEFQQDIKDFLKSFKQYKKTGPIEVVEPGTKPNIAGLPSTIKKRGMYSGQFPTVELEINDDEIYIVLAGGVAGSNKTSTDFKESFVGYFFASGKFERITKDNYSDKIPDILEDIRRNGISGMSSKVVEDNIKTLSASEDSFNAGIAKSLNNAISIAEYLASSKYKKWSIERSSLFSEVKSTGASVTGLLADKWNPSDIFLIKPGGEKTIREALTKATSEANEELAVGHLNSIFVNEWGETTNPILGISLKEQNAQAGKAKSFLKSMQRQEGTELESYNLTAAEDNLKLKEYYDLIDEMRTKVGKRAKQLQKYFTYSPDKNFQKEHKSKDFNYTRAKYAALKLLYYLMENTTPSKNIFIEVASFGLSLGKNPTFFKLIGSEKGAAHEPEQFPAQSGVELADENNLIEIIDKNSAKGVNIEYKVKFKDNIYQVVLMIRTNISGSSTVTLEINKFKPA